MLEEDLSRPEGERWVLEYLNERFPRDHEVVVFDVGGNVGDYAIECLNSPGKNARLYCFEPGHSAFEILARRLAGRVNVRLFNFGFGAEEKSAFLFMDNLGVGTTSLCGDDMAHFGIKPRYAETIELRTLDSFYFRLVSRICADEKGESMC